MVSGLGTEGLFDEEDWPCGAVVDDAEGPCGVGVNRLGGEGGGGGVIGPSKPEMEWLIR